MKQSAVALLLAVSGVMAAPLEDKGPPPKKEPAKEATGKADPAKPADRVDPKQTAEHIVRDAQAAGKRLADQDPGTETRRLQSEVLKGLDALIRLAQDPPPSDQKQSTSPPMGGTGGNAKQQSQPSGGPGNARQPRSGSRRDRKEGSGSGNAGPDNPRPNGGTGQQGDPFRQDPLRMQGQTGGSPPNTPPRAGAGQLGELYKDVWGHLPERLRQEMDLYYREQFMPRYQELLRQYYSSLAERKRSGSGE